MKSAGFIVDDAASCREASTAGYKTQFALEATIAAAIYAAIALNQSFNCQVSVSTYSQQDIQNTVRDMIAGGFAVSQVGSTLTISW